MNAKDLKKSGIIAVALTIVLMGFWFGFAKISLGIDYNPVLWTKYNLKKDSVIDSRIIILCGTNGAKIVFGSTTGYWVGTPTDSTLPTIGLNTGTGKLETKNAGTETASPIVKYHDDLSGITANQHHNQVHGAADHTGNIGAESQIAFGTQSGHAHTGTDSTKISYPNLLSRSHGAADHTGNIGAESQIAFGTQSGHAHTGTDSTKISYPNLLNRSHGVADHSGNIGTESQITFGTQSGHSHNGSDSTKIDYSTAPVRIGTDTTGNTDNMSEGTANKYYTDARVNVVIGSSSIDAHSDVNVGTATNNQFLKKVNNVWVGADNSVSVNWSDVGGTPTASSDISGTPTAGKIVYSNDGTVNNWLSELRLPGTSTAPTGTSTYGLVKVITSLATTSGATGSSTVLLAHMNGAASATAFVDSSVFTNNGTATGNAQLDTTIKYFGSASLLLDGSGDKAGFPDSDNYTIGTQAFQIDAHIRMASLGSNQAFFGHWDSPNEGYQFYYNGGGGAGLVFGTRKNAAWITISQGGTAGWSANTWYWVRASRAASTSTVNIYRDGTLLATGSNSVNFANYTSNLILGTGLNDEDFNGRVDEIRFIIGTNTPVVVPTNEYFEVYNYTQYKLKYYCPETGLELLTLTSPGSATTEKSVIAFNASSTVFGSESSAYSGSSSSYVVDASIGNVIALSYVVPSTSDTKVVISKGTRSQYLDDFKNLRVEKWYRKNGMVADKADVENNVKYNFMQKEYELWKLQNIETYTTIVYSDKGSKTISIDYKKLENDFNTVKEIEWASLINKQDLIDEAQILAETDTLKENIGLIVDDPSTPSYLKGRDGRTRDIATEIGALELALQELISIVETQQTEIEALRLLVGL